MWALRRWATALILETYARDFIDEILDDGRASTIDVGPYLGETVYGNHKESAAGEIDGVALTPDGEALRRKARHVPAAMADLMGLSEWQ